MYLNFSVISLFGKVEIGNGTRTLILFENICAAYAMFPHIGPCIDESESFYLFQIVDDVLLISIFVQPFQWAPNSECDTQVHMWSRFLIVDTQFQLHLFFKWVQLICILFTWQAVFVGHDHGLDWCCPYHKLWLCYARHTGYGGYGNWPRGARIVEITEDPFSIKSWIRMEDGLVHSEVILS